MSPLVVPLILLLFSCSPSSSVPIGSRDILRAIDIDSNTGPDLHDAAVDLNTTNFDQVLRNTPATYAIVEFFAHWCPACRNYKPHYEKVARLFNGPDAVHPGIILMTRVDCASKINTRLCDNFSVGHYPMLLWGNPSKFVSGSWDPKKDKNEIRLIDDGRTAERLLNWINKQIGSFFSLDDQKFENDHLASNASDPEQIARAVYDIEEATSTAYDIILEQKMIKSETRASLIKFLQILVVHHPSRRCRKGSAEVLVNFDDLCPSDMGTPNKQEATDGNGKGALRNFQICGKEVPRGYWMFCRGSKNETRGFSCGLWILLHSLSVRIEDGESQLAFTAMCDFIHNFFICEECRQHFYEMCLSVSSPFNKTRDFALWLWSAHNKVNVRLIKEEASLGTGDPKFRKIIWPSKQLCPSCYFSLSKNNDGTSQIDWNRDEVFKFLVSYYGKMLVSLYKDKGLLGDDGTDRVSLEDLATTTNAVVVPVGAALAIALASCAFGALACFCCDVGDLKNEVAAILQEADLLLEKQYCLGSCRNIRQKYNLVKRVAEKSTRAEKLITRGHLERVAAMFLRPVVDELPLAHTVGLDSLSQRVCSCFDEDAVGIVGLYGVRGVGKTTLLKKINNDCLLKFASAFGIVIWVAASNQASVTAAQEVIANKLRINGRMWQNRSQDEKAIEIFNIMKRHRFLLLLDNVCQRIDLSEIGVPLPDAKNRSKVIITTRSLKICSEMEAQRRFKVECLPSTEALNLFMLMVREDTLSSHPDIRNLAYSVMERCKGLPLALVTVGRALADKNTLGEWEQAIQELENFLLEISDRLPRAVVDEMPLGHIVGLDRLYERVCSCLTDYKVRIIGLYGTGGIGKTTLMKKINNEFLKTSHQFDTVIWVAVSKKEKVQESVRAAQEVIRNQLQIPDSMWQGRTEDERATKIFNILKTKKFVLLLDDVWQPFDLSKIGVPPLPSLLYFRVIITTRLQKTCTEMEVQRKFRVECLEQEEALALFMKKVGENTLNSHPDIPQLAEKVAERCKGLPLAIVTVGRAMADKNSPEKWDQAIRELKKFPVEISGMELQFGVLKLSYDYLTDDITKSCFIYCSVFPKGYEIRNDELIEHWIGEGFFDHKDIYEARRRGHKIIEDLKNASLLEEGDGFKECIKMHDVIHDMALWIGQECGKKMNKILVYESLGRVEAERVTSWKEAERISLWGWNIEKLPETPHCSNLQTLFVRECIQLKTFPRGFFQFMPLIRVLDLSTTHCLTELPDGIDRLMNLEYINLSMTQVKELPIEIMKLTKLRCLLLDGMLALIIPPQLISSLSSLQLFSMYDGNALSAFRTTLLEELESIEAMDELSLSFRNVAALNKLLSSYKLQRCIRRLSIHDCRDFLLLELSSISLNYLETLVIFNCLQLEEMKISMEKQGGKGLEQSYDTPNPQLIARSNQHFRSLRDVKIWSCPKLLNLTWLIYAACLQSLSVQSCESMKEVISIDYVTSSTQHASIFTRLTSLVLGGMPMLESIYQGALLFPSLEIISVINCPRLRRLPIDSNSAAKSLKKIEGDLTWWGRLEWKDESVEETFTNYFCPQYLADPIQHSGEVQGKKKLVVEGSTSRAAT